jgi:hypothetical protein
MRAVALALLLMLPMCAVSLGGCARPSCCRGTMHLCLSC